jgi:ferredoxin
MKVFVDEDICTLCGICADICPEVFELSETSCIVKPTEITGEIADRVNEAVESCPVEAITIEE